MENVTGCFKERDYGKYFFYKKTNDAWALSHGLEYEFTGEQERVRYARVLKTVVHVAVDENPDGSPVLEKWYVTRLWEVTKQAA